MFEDYNGKFDTQEYKDLMKKNYDGIEFFMEDMAEFVKAEPAGLLMLEALLKTSADGGGQHMLRQFAMPIGNSQALIDQNFEDGEKRPVKKMFT